MNENLTESEILALSVSPHHFYEQAVILKAAAKRIGQLFVDANSEPPDEEIANAQLGLFEVVSLTIAVSLENLIKSIILFRKLKDGMTYKHIGEFINDFRKEKIDSHNLESLVKTYSIVLNEQEKDLIANVNPYTTWAGRFSLPIKDNLIIERLKQNTFGGFSVGYFDIMDDLFSRFATEMSK